MLSKSTCELWGVKASVAIIQCPSRRSRNCDDGLVHTRRCMQQQCFPVVSGGSVFDFVVDTMIRVEVESVRALVVGDRHPRVAAVAPSSKPTGGDPSDHQAQQGKAERPLHLGGSLRYIEDLGWPQVT